MKLHNNRLGRGQYNVTGWDRSHGVPALSRVWQDVKLSNVSLRARRRYSLVIDEDVKKSNKQTVSWSSSLPHRYPILFQYFPYPAKASSFRPFRSEVSYSAVNNKIFRLLGSCVKRFDGKLGKEFHLMSHPRTLWQNEGCWKPVVATPSRMLAEVCYLWLIVGAVYCYKIGWRVDLWVLPGNLCHSMEVEESQTLTRRLEDCTECTIRAVR